MNVTIFRAWLGNEASFIAVGLNGQDRPVVGISRTSGAHACVDLWSNATTLPDSAASRRKGAQDYLLLHGDRVFADWHTADQADRLTASEGIRPVARLDLHAGFDLAPLAPLREMSSAAE